MGGGTCRGEACKYPIHLQNSREGAIGPPCRLVPAQKQVCSCLSAVRACPSAHQHPYSVPTYPPGPKSTHLRLDPTLPFSIHPLTLFPEMRLLATSSFA